MTTKRKMGTLIIALFVFGILLVISKYTRPCSIENISIPINENDSKVAISQKIIETYLKTHKSGKVCLKGMIKNYEIKEIKTNGFDQDGENSFAVTASFLVKPLFSFGNAYWIRQNGKMENNGWINSNPVFLIITKNNKYYHLQEIINKN